MLWNHMLILAPSDGVEDALEESDEMCFGSKKKCVVGAMMV